MKMSASLGRDVLIGLSVPKRNQRISGILWPMKCQFMVQPTDHHNIPHLRRHLEHKAVVVISVARHGGDILITHTFGIFLIAIDRIIRVIDTCVMEAALPFHLQLFGVGPKVISASLHTGMLVISSRCRLL